MAFYTDTELIYSSEVLELDASGKSECLGLWATAGSWASHARTGGVVPTRILLGLHAKLAHADELVRVGLWDRNDSGYEFMGATAAYKAVDMTSSKRPTSYVYLKFCKLPSKAFIDWCKANKLPKNRQITKAMRAAVLAEHGMTCWLCSEPIAEAKDVHLDHVQPRSLSGADDVANLRPAHARCNVIRGARSVEEFRKLLRSRGLS